MENSNHTKRRIAADICSCVDDVKSSLHLEFTIPGVEKGDIKLKLNEDGFNLTAERNDLEYVSSGGFCCPVEAKSAEANYENGLLLLNIPLKDPWKGAHDMKIH